MTKPTKFKSGYFTWKIVWIDEAADECYGKTDMGNKRILIYKHQDSETERETLLHEILHVVLEDKIEAVFNHDGERKLEEKEESLVRLTSPVLMQILCENKELQNYLLGRKDERRRKNKS
tara:strand:+ start:107 stop:466 length:360 start_codon:yes stop_codon:yes gene_type:complete